MTLHFDKLISGITAIETELLCHTIWASPLYCLAKRTCPTSDAARDLLAHRISIYKRASLLSRWLAYSGKFRPNNDSLIMRKSRGFFFATPHDNHNMIPPSLLSSVLPSIPPLFAAALASLTLNPAQPLIPARSLTENPNFPTQCVSTW